MPSYEGEDAGRRSYFQLSVLMIGYVERDWYSVFFISYSLYPQCHLYSEANVSMMLIKRLTYTYI